MGRQLMTVLPKKTPASKQVEFNSLLDNSLHTPSPTPTPIVTATPTRKSKRNMMLADQDSIERASQLKARKNLEVSNNQGTEHVNSFISFFR